MIYTDTTHTELAEGYLQSDFFKDTPISAELWEGLWALAGDAALKGDMELCERAMDSLPLEVEFFCGMKFFYSKEELGEIVKEFNMSKVIEVFGESYLEG